MASANLGKKSRESTTGCVATQHSSSLIMAPPEASNKPSFRSGKCARHFVLAMSTKQNLELPVEHRPIDLVEPYVD
eukprot:1189738-Prorocentrum_minimum.AAC.3